MTEHFVIGLGSGGKTLCIAKKFADDETWIVGKRLNHFRLAGRHESTIASAFDKTFTKAPAFLTSEKWLSEITHGDIHVQRAFDVDRVLVKVPLRGSRLLLYIATDIYDAESKSVSVPGMHVVLKQIQSVLMNASR